MHCARHRRLPTPPRREPRGLPSRRRRRRTTSVFAFLQERRRRRRRRAATRRRSTALRDRSRETRVGRETDAPSLAGTIRPLSSRSRSSRAFECRESRRSSKTPPSTSRAGVRRARVLRRRRRAARRSRSIRFAKKRPLCPARRRGDTRRQRRRCGRRRALRAIRSARAASRRRADP